MKDARLSVRTALLLALLSLMMLPVMALAQSQAISLDNFDPTEKDMTRWLVSAIFGNWGSGEKVPMLGGAMQVLNNFALAFGTLMFSYVAIVGTMNSAQDGHLLGRKWSSMWVPLRFVMGTAMLVPLSTGYSTIQHAILWLALAGGGAASMVWSEAVSNFSGSQAAAMMSSQEFDAKTQLVMREILKAEVCMAMQQANKDDAGIRTPFAMTATASRPKLGDPVQSGVASTSYSKSFVWGPQGAGTGLPDDYCGSAKTTAFETTGGSSFLLKASGMSPGHGYENGSLGTTTAERELAIKRGRDLVDGQEKGLVAAATELRQTAKKWVAAQSGGAPVTDEALASAIKSASATYRTVVTPYMTLASTSFDQRLSAFTEASKEAGWIMAGSTFFQLAQLRSAATRVMHSVPSATAKSRDGNIPDVTTSAVAFDTKAMGDKIDANFQESGGAWYTNFGTWFAQAAAEFLSFDPEKPTHALVQIKDSGDRIIVATEVAAVAMIGATFVGLELKNNIAGWAVDKISGLATTFFELFNMLLPALYAAFIAVLGVGITMAFIIPLLPFTLTVGSIVGWLMALFSAVVAGPIWLAGHLHPEGDDIAGKGIGGYMILLETVTRPIFIVFGLIGAFLIMDPVLRLVAVMYKASITMLQGSSTTGIVSIVVLAILYVVVVFSTVRSTMSLTYVLSETVYRWIGGQHAGMEQARDFSKSADEGAAGARGGIQGAAGAAGAARMNRVKEMKDQRKKTAANDPNARESAAGEK